MLDWDEFKSIRLLARQKLYKDCELNEFRYKKFFSFMPVQLKILNKNKCCFKYLNKGWLTKIIKIEEHMGWGWATIAILKEQDAMYFMLNHLN